MMIGLILTVGCGADGVIDAPGVNTGDDSGFTNAADQDAPLIEFAPIEDNQKSGTDVVLNATISDGEDGVGVFLATLYYRNETDSSKDWQSIGFVRQTDPEQWIATIQADAQHSSGMWYYLLALDGAQNEALEPQQGGDQPYHFGYTD